MIKTFKDIITEHPEKQIWKFLRLFLDTSYTSEINCNYLGISLKSSTYQKHEKNIEKQATQIGYCIRQAEEYFHAALEVGLSTRPLLMYYGATSLSTALMLIRNDGNFSLDRIGPEFKRHGLELKLPDRAKTFHEPNSFFDNVRYSVQTPGFFCLFYDCLAPCVYHVDGEIHDMIPNTFGSKTFIRVTNLLTGAGSSAKSDVLAKEFSALDLIKMMPDMYSFITELQIKMSLCKGSVQSRLERYYTSPDHGIQHQSSVSIVDFFINNLTTVQREHFLSLYQDEPEITIAPNFGLNTNILRLQSKVKHEGKQLSAPIGVVHPDIVDDIKGAKYYALYPDNYICEPAQHFILLYCLGMLARYYPHVWMRALENSQIAEITDSLLNAIWRKFPNLILDQMTETRHYLHN